MKLMQKVRILTPVLALIFFVFGWYSNSFVVSKNITIKKTLLKKIKKKKTLDVIILNSPTVYFVGPVREMGFEYDLISDYAKEIGVTLNLKIVNTVEEALKLTKDNVGDITIAGLTITPSREQEFLFGPQYYMVKEILVCNQSMYKTNNFPRDVEDMIGLNIMVGKDTSYEQTLVQISKEISEFKFKTTSEFSTEELLTMVYKKEIDCTLSDSNIYQVNQRYYPELKLAFVLSEHKSLAWALRKGDYSLKESLYDWLNRYERSGKMASLKASYYASLKLFDYYDTKVFHKRLKRRLPKYKKMFQEAGEKYNIPWMLLAAQSYQESHWNPRAKSHTGVRGMMMLTLSTAKQMGVKSRLNAKQSIFGGAKYLASIEKRFPPEVTQSNRWAFTLAAYNVGMGHIHDAQVLARKLHKNPYVWSDMKKVLPLLRQKKYYKNLKNGYARGDEPVRYIDGIQHYIDIINKKENLNSSL